MRPFIGEWMRQWVVSASVIALLTAVAVPHQHDHATASHPTSACRACNIQDGYAATPPTSVVEVPVATGPSHRLLQIDERIALTFFSHSSASRAPPRSS